MQSPTRTEPDTTQAPVEVDPDEILLAWPEGDPRWLLVPEAGVSSEGSDAQKPEPVEAIKAFNRMLTDRQRESATEVRIRR